MSHRCTFATVALPQELSLEALSNVYGGAWGEVACRTAGAGLGALAGVGIGFVGAGGPTSVAVNSVKVGKTLAKMSVDPRFNIGASNAGKALEDGGVIGTGLAVADTAATVASFVPGPYGAAGTAWTLGRFGSDQGAALCGY